jgi:hypothetical protein
MLYTICSAEKLLRPWSSTLNESPPITRLPSASLRRFRRERTKPRSRSRPGEALDEAKVEILPRRTPEEQVLYRTAVRLTAHSLHSLAVLAPRPRWIGLELSVRPFS